jgi:hypothetical protein
MQSLSFTNRHLLRKKRTDGREVFEGKNRPIFFYFFLFFLFFRCFFKCVIKMQKTVVFPSHARKQASGWLRMGGCLLNVNPSLKVEPEAASVYTKLDAF